MYSYHIHSSFSDGQNTPEELVLAAIEKGLFAMGCSDHGYTEFDLRYCMRDLEGYRTEMQRVKDTYKNQIQIYLGVEEDAFSLVDRSKFDYIIGSCHYICRDNQYYPLDSSCEHLKKCLELFQHDVVALAENYYSFFCNYIATRRPDIIGHFDVITKFDELDTSLFLHNIKYNEVAEKYVNIAAESDCIFEINTGAMARGLCTTPYPRENLLHILKKRDAKIILSSDSHSKETIDFGFEEAIRYLRDIGFRYAFALMDGEFKKYELLPGM